MTLETKGYNLHGHVVHLIEELPNSVQAARQADNHPYLRRTEG